jgi:hypothetical protein
MAVQLDAGNKISKTYRLRTDVVAYVEYLAKLAEFGDMTTVLEQLVIREAGARGVTFRGGRVVALRNGKTALT